jgi:hypothetical protein
MSTITLLLNDQKHVEVDEHSVMVSELLRNRVKYSDVIRVNIPYYTQIESDTLDAIKALKCLKYIVELTNKFNHPVKPEDGYISLKTMFQLYIDIVSARRLWKVMSDTPVYTWLKPDVELTSSMEAKDDMYHLFQSYSFPRDAHTCFEKACRDGNVQLAKWVYSLGEINLTDMCLFEAACNDGKLEVAKWLHSIGHGDCSANNGFVFAQACYLNQLEVAKWLYSLDEVNIHFRHEYAFRYSCAYGHLEVAQWLHSIGHIDIHAYEEHGDIGGDAFANACRNGHLDVANWLFKIGANIHALGDYGFKGACELDQRHVIDWMYDTLGGFIVDEEVLKWITENKNTKFLSKLE